MSDILFVLGAGASQQSGAPLMDTFFEAAVDLLRSGRVQNDERYFQNVLSVVASLQIVHSKANLDLWNVESVLSAIEMGQILQRFFDYDPQRLDGLARAMRTLMVRTIEETQLYRALDGTFEVPSPYGHFADIINDLLQEGSRLTVAVATFNYDLALDYAFESRGIQADYGLRDDDPLRVPLLKLHGSLNWGRCRVCGAIVPWRVRDFLSARNEPFPPAESQIALRIGSHIRELQHCKSSVEDRPMIVPPTWSKTSYYRNLSVVWSRAAKELAGVEEIHIIGYSLPASDEFFRYLYAIGTAGNPLIRRFCVYNPDESGTVERRFRGLLGPGVERKFEFVKTTFGEALPMIQRAMADRLNDTGWHTS